VAFPFETLLAMFGDGQPSPGPPPQYPLYGGQEDQYPEIPPPQMAQPGQDGIPDLQSMPQPGFLQSMATSVLGNIPIMGQDHNRYGEPSSNRTEQALGIIGPLLAHGVSAAMQQGQQGQQQAVAAANARTRAVAEWMNKNRQATYEARQKARAEAQKDDRTSSMVPGPDGKPFRVPNTSVYAGMDKSDPVVDTPSKMRSETGLLKAKTSTIATYMKPPNQSSMGAMVEAQDPYAVAKAIAVDETMPPDLSAYGRPFQSAVVSVLAKQFPDYNYRAANMLYRGQKQFVATGNQRGMVMLRQTIATTRLHLDRARELNEALVKAGVPRGTVQEANRFSLGAAVRGSYGRDVAVKASQFQAQIGLMQSELATVFSNGAAPTDEARKLAREMIRFDLPAAQVEGNLANIGKDLDYKAEVMQTSEPMDLPGGGQVDTWERGLDGKPQRVKR
jgi:hypothetical protein